MAIELKPSQLGSALRAEARKVSGALERGALRSAHRGKALLVRETDAKGITDMGQYKGSFEVQRGVGLAQRLGAVPLVTITNTSPIAGIIELGARPHPVSKEGIEAIARWVERKLGTGLAAGPVRQQVHGPTGKVKFSKPRKPKAISEEAMEVANAIAWKIRHHGQQGRHVFGDAMGRIERYFAEEVERLLRKPSGKGGVS